MIIVECALILILIIVAATASVNDIRMSVVPNKLLICALVAGTVLNTIYYAYFANTYLWKFILTNIVSIIISILFYAFHVWSAGDSKLAISLVLLVPARIYAEHVSMAPAVVVFVFIFSIGFLYVAGESIILGISEKALPLSKPSKMFYYQVIKRYLVISSILSICSQLISAAFPVFYSNNRMLILFMNLFIILLIQDKKWVEKNIVVIILTTVWVIILFATRARIVLNWWIYAAIALIVFVRSFAEKHNYKTIPSSALRPGMILSFGTVFGFSQSRVAGLPQFTTEDLRTRLSHEEIQSIRRWEQSKYGKSEVVIVRKIPFAIVIAVSMVLYVGTEVLIR